MKYEIPAVICIMPLFSVVMSSWKSYWVDSLSQKWLSEYIFCYLQFSLRKRKDYIWIPSECIRTKSKGKEEPACSYSIITSFISIDHFIRQKMSQTYLFLLLLRPTEKSTLQSFSHVEKYYLGSFFCVSSIRVSLWCKLQFKNCVLFVFYFTLDCSTYPPEVHCAEELFEGKKFVICTVLYGSYYFCVEHLKSGLA